MTDTNTLKPRDAKDVEEAVQWGLREGASLELVGHGSKRLLGRPIDADVGLDVSALSGITLYEPEELVLSARAGTPLAEIETLLALQSQQLAFEPLDCGPLLGKPPGAGTIGGTIGVNLSGPRRIKAGSARDHVLGLTAVSGRGETFKSGGRVVKNVTGYDLAKLMTGSWGTLAAITEVTLKALPSPETEATVALLGLDDAAANRAMAAAMGSACDVSGAAHLPAATAARLPVETAVAAGRALTVLRLEGVRPSVAHRAAELQKLMQPYGDVVATDELVSRRLWAAIRDVKAFAAGRAAGDPSLWRITTAPSRGAELVARITAAAAAEALYDWAGGLLWIAVPARADAAAGPVRAAVAAVGGSAMLFRATAELRAALDVFDPQDASLAALTKRVKEGFDPRGVLNPGRIWAQV
jgi:glycolate oxidase FAD binding subunit